MGASVEAYWPGITEEQKEFQPGFYNDCKNWGDWMAEHESSPELVIAIRQLDAAALLTYMTDGMSDDDVEWVSPAQMRDAARKVREAVQSGRYEAKIILETYARNARGDDPISEQFIRDLDDVEALATWAEKENADRMTLEVNW